MKTLEAKPFDQNAENWKRENRLFTPTVLEAGASGAKSNFFLRIIIGNAEAFPILGRFCKPDFGNFDGNGPRPGARVEK